MSARAVGRVGGSDQAAEVWWFFVVIGFLWLVFALLVFQVDAATVHGIAILTGIVCIAGPGSSSSPPLRLRAGGAFCASPSASRSW